ncbi:hypothetical protein [Curtobacterium flaccumfaciens]|uniref:hypothetical protein n=1 Tax=Curtobacterium flaccumfaciens TaxID=2035 RepID=UPI001BDDEEC9|nr:hypothetical protein [Curtobacterium flaccumfaciens]MBT1631493.1 hypothetical protein [Curtobacterium flaccumfaciens pv. oortii]MCX2846801.1 hypothetical protein [Curtobacterium flaccumfaciens pv. oortii]
MDDAAPQSFNVVLDEMASGDLEVAGALGHMIEERGLLETLVLGIVELVPDATRWRLTITGDMVATVNRLSPRVASYTTKRGAGEAGAITIPQTDGTFDIVISASVLFATREDTGSVEELIAHATAAAAHLSRHEAGHVALQLRGEDCHSFQDVEGLDGATARWRKMLAAHVDDSRIEQYTATHAPSPLRNADHVADAIAHLRSELNAAKQTWTADMNSAGSRTVIAANNLVRVLAYLAPELGMTADGTPRRPDPTPDGWHEYVEDLWDAWSNAFHRLRSANEEMSSAELGAVLVELCQIMIAWMHSFGVEWGIDGDDEYIYWVKATY